MKSPINVSEICNFTNCNDGPADGRNLQLTMTVARSITNVYYYGYQLTAVAVYNCVFLTDRSEKANIIIKINQTSRNLLVLNRVSFFELH